MIGSFDPDLNMVYWGVGNPAPDFDGDVRQILIQKLEEGEQKAREIGLGVLDRVRKKIGF